MASLTKSFTAAAISLLLKAGALTLDDPLSKFLPEFPNGDKITVRHLLMHKSGIGQADLVSETTMSTRRFSLRSETLVPNLLDFPT